MKGRCWTKTNDDAGYWTKDKNFLNNRRKGVRGDEKKDEPGGFG
jgi:hypothetical protein